MKWFSNPKSLVELKKQYKKLAMQHHPDVGGKNEDMKEINAEYDLLFSKLKNIHETADGKTYEQKEESNETPELFRKIINSLVGMVGINIEICGSWLWITGNTYFYKEDLKNLDFKYSKNKKAWYYHDEAYHKKGKKTFSLDEIRERYGSRTIEAQQNLQLA